MASVQYRILHSYDELLSITTELTNKVAAQPKGLRWCWIAEGQIFSSSGDRTNVQ
jgi:hypothetical protein